MQHTKNNILELLLREGHSLSKQRIYIIDSLWESQGIDDIDDFWIAIRKKYTIGWSTVHRTLSILEYLGCLTRVSGTARGKRYQLSFHKNTD